MLQRFGADGRRALDPVAGVQRGRDVAANPGVGDVDQLDLDGEPSDDRRLHLEREGIYADGEPVGVSEDLVEIVPPSPLDPAVDYDERPLVAGGQGRSDEEVREDAEAAVFGLGLALLAFVGHALMAALGFLIGRAV